MAFTWPVPEHYMITSGYYDQRDYGLHGGFDIAAPAVPCVAIGAGIVVFGGWVRSAGRSVYIELEGDYRVHYCHLSRIDVVVGQAVAAGDTIGLVGGSGHGVDDYYGSHLHLNLFASEQPATGPSHWVSWVGMYAVDPELYLRQEEEMTEDEIRAIARDEMMRMEFAAYDGPTLKSGKHNLATWVWSLIQHTQSSHHDTSYSDAKAVKAIRDKLS